MCGRVTRKRKTAGTKELSKEAGRHKGRMSPGYTIFAPNMFYSKANDSCNSKVITKPPLGTERNVSKHSC